MDEYYEVKKERNMVPTWVVVKHTGHDMAVVQARFYNEDNAVVFCNILNAKLRREERNIVIVHRHRGVLKGVWFNHDVTIKEFETYADYTGEEERLMSAIRRNGKVEIK